MPAVSSIIAGVGAAATLGGTAASMISGSSAANKAAGAQLAGLKSAEKFQKYQMDVAREDVAPWRIAGEEALQAYRQLLGLGQDMSAYEHKLADLGQEPIWNKRIPTGYSSTGEWLGTAAAGEGEYGYVDPATGERVKRNKKYDEYLKSLENYRIEKERLQGVLSAPRYDPTQLLKSTPGYQFRLGEGVNALERSAAARGSQLSGQQIKAVQEYGEGLASNEYNYLINRLASLAGVGQSAATTASNVAMQGGQAVGQNLAAQGAARASGYINQANVVSGGLGALTGGINTGIQNYMLGKYMT